MTLENHVTYDSQKMMSVNELAELAKQHGMPEGFNVRYMLYVFNVKPVAQSKIEGKRGRGTLLYSRDIVIKAMDYVKAWPHS